jgi:hypothetical protein
MIVSSAHYHQLAKEKASEAIESVFTEREIEDSHFWIMIRRNKPMKAYLINKNLCFYYWLRKRIGKKKASSSRDAGRDAAKPSTRWRS